MSVKSFFKLPQKIGCAPGLLQMIKSFNKIMQSTVLFDVSISEPFPINSRVNQSCILAPTLFGILFSLLLSYAFSSYEEGIFLYKK